MGFVALTYVAWYRDADLRGDGPRYLGALQHVKPCTFVAVKREAPHRCCLRFFCSPGCAQGTCFAAAVPIDPAQSVWFYIFGGSAPHAAYGGHFQVTYLHPEHEVSRLFTSGTSPSCPCHLLTFLLLLSDNAEFEANVFLA